MTDQVEQPGNVYQQRRAEMERMADLLDQAAEVGGFIKARRRSASRQRCRSRQYAARLQSAGVPRLCPDRDDAYVETQQQHTLHVNDGLYVSPRLVDQHSQIMPTGHWLRNRAWQMRICGRAAVGVGLLRKSSPDLAGEKVYHATCKDRLCPACNAKMMAHGAPALKRLIREEFVEGQRLFFGTLTVRHKQTDSLRSTRRVLDRGWARLIRTKWFRETFSERLRCAEIENTKDNGWHPHFHLLLRLRPGCKASFWSHDKIERELQRLWRRSTSREGRASWQVDLRELVVNARCSETDQVSEIRYWLRPEERRRYERLARQGKVRLTRRGASLFRVQTLDDVVDELTKYVTKRSADGVKPNQIPLWEWAPEQLHEYAVGIRYWNLRRASKGWEQVLIEFDEDQRLLSEIEADENGGYEYFPWARIIEQCREAAWHKLNADQADQFANDYPRILSALDREGCDVSADMIRGYIFRFFGDKTAPLKKLKVQPWDRRAWKTEKSAQALAEAQAKYKARHWRVLLKLRRGHDKGSLGVRVAGLGMSRRRRDECLDDLINDGLVKAHDSPGCFELTDDGRRFVPTSVPDPKRKHAARRARRELQRMLPGMIFSED